ncbi:MAG: hypothetical protein ACI9HK_006161 [Pirellulaceae bacterium]
MVADALQAKISPQIHFVSALYQRLAQAASVACPSEFVDRTEIVDQQSDKPELY